MKRILFQGDSITDAGRLKDAENDGKSLGFGYPAYAAAEIGTMYPNEFEFFNKGISGNKITDLYARMKRDIIAFAPDYMSIMIGVNDIWHSTMNDGVDLERFEQIYRWLIEDVKKALPDIKIMLIGAYCDSITNNLCEGFNEGVKARAAVAEKLAKEYGFTFMDSQSLINHLETIAPVKYWTDDGVHPTIFGHKMLADEWVKNFKTMI